VWRKSWSLMVASLALCSDGLKCLPNRVMHLMIVAVVVGNTRPLSCQRESTLSLSRYSGERGGFNCPPRIP
jgi:hypothetical protein